MTREQYLEMRNNNELNLDLFYDYYLNECKNFEVEPLIKSLEEFIPLFSHFMNTFSVNVNKVLTYFDNKFEINKLINTKENKIIRYV